MGIKRIFAALLSLVLTFASVTWANAEPFDAWMPDVSNVGTGKASFFIAEDTQANNMSTRTGSRTTEMKGYESWWCENFSSTNLPSCDLNDDTAWFSQVTVLPYCSNAAKENCVEGLTLTIPGKDPVNATYVRNIAGIKFEPVDALGLYEASTISLWSAPGAPSAAGLTDYAVNVRTRLVYDSALKKFVTDELVATVSPYRVQTGDSYGVPVGYTVQNDRGTTNTGVGINVSQECLFTETRTCGVMQDFTEGTSIKLTSRISKQVGGWFKGRLQTPEISVKPFSATASTISVEAQAVSVARLQTTVAREAGIEGIREIYLRSGVMGDLWSGQSAFTASQGEMAFTYLNRFREIAKDTSSSISKLWSFATVSAGQGSRCLADTSKVLGIVTTNSTVYDGSAPVFSNGVINYSVGGLHYLPDGKALVRGSYDLVMRSDTARCLYRFSTAPISASINVVDSNGENSTSVTSFSERAGWVHFSASGFHFSTPQIKVKLTQSKAKKTITCVSVKKPSLKKIVNATAPKCPSGYRLKK
jgi:hypothetical protein